MTYIKQRAPLAALRVPAALLRRAVGTGCVTWQPFGPRQDGKECPAIPTKKATPFGMAFLVRSLAMTYSHMGKPHTTIGDVPFHY